MPTRYKSAATLQREAQRDLARGVDAAIYAMVQAVGAGVVEAVADADARTAGKVKAMADVFRRGLSPAERLRAHQELGERAQRAVLASYAQTVTRRGNARGNRFPYRKNAAEPNRRYAGGALRAALASKEFFEATHDGLRIINVTDLNRRAKQWARLNAGAGPIGQGSRRRFVVRWSNLVVASLGLEQEPRPGFFLPRGFWYNRASGQLVSPGANPAGSDEFYPMGAATSVTRLHGGRRAADANRKVSGRSVGPQRPGIARRRPSRGIKARNFLDAGVASIARELGPTYDRLYQRLWDQGVVGAARNVPGPRPSRVGSRARTFRRY